MWKVSLHSLRTRVWQLVLCLGAVVIGVAAIAATLNLSALVRTTTDGVVAATVADVNVVADGSLVATDAALTPPMLTDQHVADIAAMAGIESARGMVRGTQLHPVTSNGEVLSSQLTPIVTGSFPAVVDSDDPALTIGEGRAPESPGEVVMDAATLARTGAGIGDDVTFARPGAHEAFEAQVVGVVFLGESDTAGAAFALFSDEGARELFLAGREGWNAIHVELDEDSDIAASEIITAVRGTVPNEYTAVPGSDVVDATRFQLHRRLTAAQVGVWVAGVLVLGVATALVSTTTAHLVARRRDDAAFLRRHGASKFKIALPVLTESLLVGLLGSLLALPLGQVAARTLNEIGASHGLSLGMAIPPLTGLEQWICIGIGALLTVLTAQRHATAPTFTLPLVPKARLPRPRLRFSDAAWTSVGLVAVGTGLLVAGAVVPDMPAPAVWAVIGAVTVLVGAVVATPVLGAPVVRVIGLALRPAIRDVSTLASRNVVRHPNRFTKAAAALVLGTGLVSTFAVLGGSGNASAHHDVEENLQGDLFITSTVPGGFGREIGAAATALPQVEQVRSYGLQRVIHDGKPLDALTTDIETLEELMTFEIIDGRAPRTSDEVLVSAAHSASSGLVRGGSVTLTVNQERVEARVSGVFELGRGLESAEFITGRDMFTSLHLPDVDALVSITLGSASDTGRVTTLLEDVTAANPLLRVQTPQELADARGEMLTTVSETVQALLGFLAVAAVIGITGGLLLALHERRREFRALRLVGMDKTQITGMVALEAFIMGAVGGLVGTVAGTVAGWGLQQGLSELGYTILDVPWGRLFGLFGIGVLVGVVSAILPAVLAWQLPDPVVRARGTHEEGVPDAEAPVGAHGGAAETG